MKHRKIIALIMLLFLSKVIVAQELKQLNIKDAIDLSLKNNKQLKAGKARIDIATSTIKEAEDNRLPNFNVSGSYLRILSSSVDIKSNSNSTSGGGNSNGTPAVNQAAYGIANLSYPVYAGGRIKYGIESAKYLEQAAKLDVENDKEAVILNTINAFANLYKANTVITLIKESLASSRQRDSTFANLERNGLLARNDLLKTELQTSNIELSLLDAENNRRVAEVNMNLMLGLKENTKIAIDSTGSRQNISLKTFEEYETLALQNRNDIRAITFRKQAANTAVKIARAEGYPTIALTGGYIAAYVPHFVTITNAINAGVGVQYNLASLWKTNTKLAQAKARVAETEANEEQLNDAVRLQINRDYQNYLLSQKKIEVYDKALYQATENYRITKNKYDNSLVATTDLLDADVAKLQANLDLSNARVDALLAYYRLLQTAGIIGQSPL